MRNRGADEHEYPPPHGSGFSGGAGKGISAEAQRELPQTLQLGAWVNTPATVTDVENY